MNKICIYIFNFFRKLRKSVFLNLSMVFTVAAIAYVILCKPLFDDLPYDLKSSYFEFIQDFGFTSLYISAFLFCAALIEIFYRLVSKLFKVILQFILKHKKISVGTNKKKFLKALDKAYTVFFAFMTL